MSSREEAPGQTQTQAGVFHLYICLFIFYARKRDQVSQLAWEHLEIPQQKLEEVTEERVVWASLLRLLPPMPEFG